MVGNVLHPVTVVTVGVELGPSWRRGGPNQLWDHGLLLARCSLAECSYFTRGYSSMER